MGMFEVFEAADEAIPSTTPTSQMSVAIPWSPRPENLNAVKIAGDFGFDPLGLGKDEATIMNYRAAEIKHARLAMLAAAGWPIAELYDGVLAKIIGASSPIETNGGLSPSVLNGGLGLVSPIYWAPWSSLPLVLSSLASRTRIFLVTTDSIPWGCTPRTRRVDRRCRTRSLPTAALR